MYRRKPFFDASLKRRARVLLVLAMVAGLLVASEPVAADPQLPISSLPVCGDEDTPGTLQFNCDATFNTPLTDVGVFEVPVGVTSIEIDWVFNDGVGLNGTAAVWGVRLVRRRVPLVGS